MKHYEEAAKLLSEHVNDENLKATSRISLMEWVAECYSKMEDKRHDAATWLELAAKTAIECKDLTEGEKRKIATKQLEQAIDFYFTSDDTAGLKRASALKYTIQSPFSDGLSSI